MILIELLRATFPPAIMNLRTAKRRDIMMTPQEMQLTVHAQQRMKTRSINLETVGLILNHGRYRTSGNCRRYELPENIIEELEKYIELPLQRSKLAKVYVIVSRDSVITVAYDYQNPSSFFSLGMRATIN